MRYSDAYKSLARRLREQQVDYPVPMRIGLDHLCDILDRYLEVANGGLRPLVVTTALMRIIGEAYSLYSRVESQGVNEADAASGVPGDVMCYGEDDALALAVEVKGYELTLIELEATIAKARSSYVTNILFTTPGLASADREFYRGEDYGGICTGKQHPSNLNRLSSTQFFHAAQGRLACEVSPRGMFGVGRPAALNRPTALRSPPY